MAKGEYIKVELKDGTKHVVLAANEAFYKKQGAKISEPTQKEIEVAFPLAKNVQPKSGKIDVTASDEYKQVLDELTTVKGEKVEIETALAAEKAKVEALTAEIESLKAEKAKVEETKK